MDGFYWLIEGALAGSPRPGSRHRFGHRTSTVDDDLDWWHEQGIRAVLSLTEEPLPTEALAARHLASLHLPVPDLTAPTPAQLLSGLAFIDEHRAQGEPIVVHCKVGQGRTGTMLAAYLIRGGLTASEALHEIRTICPGAVESPAQERALAEFAATRGWLI